MQNEILEFIESLIQKFYHTKSNRIHDLVEKSTSLEDLKLTNNEFVRLIMGCEEKFLVNLGDGSSIKSIQDLVNNIADQVNARNAGSQDQSNEDETDDKLPDPPEEINIETEEEQSSGESSEEK